MIDAGWSHKDEWRRSCKNACVTIERWDTGWTPLHGRGSNNWGVYAYIYPSHPLFNQILDDDFNQPPFYEAPLHGGLTLVRFHRNERGVTAKQIGADYQHYGDDCYSHSSSMECVRGDAEALIEWLNSFHPSEDAA